MLKSFEDFCREEFAGLYPETSGLKKTNFLEGLEYSFFSGGKRMRPQIMMNLAKHFSLSESQIFPAAFALECIHTYSLIHDDLPCMDDDDMRRGKLSHHKKYGEAHAVLAGDALLTFSFEILSKFYEPHLSSRLVRALAHAAGPFGMVGGQVLDCLTKERNLDIFEEIHYLKTAKLFCYAFFAPAVIAEKSQGFIDSIHDLGGEIGLLFQLQDDLLDIDKKTDREEENITSIISPSDLKKLIQKKKNDVEKTVQSLKLNESEGFNVFLNKLFNRSE